MKYCLLALRTVKICKICFRANGVGQTYQTHNIIYTFGFELDFLTLLIIVIFLKKL